MRKRLVIALGGNALGDSPRQQLELVKKTASTIVDLVEEGYDVAVGHGNGPQVGIVNQAFEYSSLHEEGMPAMPFPECGAMTQGYIGYHLQQAVGRELVRRGLPNACAAVVTQVVVDPDDAAFLHPSKPVGQFYGKEEAERIAAQTGYVFKEDAGRGYRRVVPSPYPVRIVELPVVKQLIGLHDVVITVGGGGIPVVEKGPGDYEGVAAVIDKDRASTRLALDLEADLLIILTAVEKVSVNYLQPGQRDLDRLTVQEAREYIRSGQFAPGSMLPKIESCIEFVENAGAGTALITSLEKAREALQGKTGTRIVKA